MNSTCRFFSRVLTRSTSFLQVLQSPLSGAPPFQGGIYALKPPPIASVLKELDEWNSLTEGVPTQPCAAHLDLYT